MMVPSSTTILPVSGDLYHWDTGTGDGTRRVPITALTTSSSWPICWCSHPSPDFWDLTLLSGSVTSHRLNSFQKGPPTEKAKLKRWWTYLSQFRLTVHHIPGMKKEQVDYISRNNFDALFGESSEALAKEVHTSAECP